jgi:lipid-binding SYLF domain-containing protein
MLDDRVLKSAAFRHPKQKEKESMLKTLSRFIVVVAAVAAFAPFAAAQTDQQKLVNEAAKSLSNFMRDPDMSWLQTHIQGARAVIIAPTIAKAGFIFGGSGGRAVVYAREANGKWAGPVFYTLATASVGFQAGISVSEGLTLVMTEKGFNSLLSSSFKMGGDASIAAGPVGAGAKSDIVADLIQFTRAKGVYGGLNLDGTVVAVSDDWNKAFYGKPVLPPDVLVTRTAHAKGGEANP